MIAIAIDGPSGVGKSSIADEIAKIFGFVHLNTGELYRATAFYIVTNNVPENLIEESLQHIKIGLNFINNKQQTILNGRNITNFLHNEKIAKLASSISELKKVRDFLLDLQRDFAQKNDVVMDGRDIGTVVLPNANVKIFLTASIESRAKRRFLELKEKGSSITYEETLDLLTRRDYLDTNRKIAPLKKAADAITLNTDNLDFKKTVEKVKNIVSTYAF